MPGLGARLRARWRALVDAVRLHPRPADDSSDTTTGSQQADTEVVDLRPRVRIPGPGSGSQGPPPEWLAYVLAQDPVWVEGGLGLSGPTFDHDGDTVADATRDLSTLTSRSLDPEPAVEAPTAHPTDRPNDRPNAGRRSRARFVRPAPSSADRASESAPTWPTHAEPTPRPDSPASTPSATAPRTEPRAAARPPRRLLPRSQPAGIESATHTPDPTRRPVERVMPATHDPDPPLAAIHHGRPPVWPVTVAPPTSEPSPAPVSRAPASSAPARVDRSVHNSHPTPTPPAVTAYSVAPRPLSALAPRTTDRVSRSLAETHVRPLVDPWASSTSLAPVVELRRDLDDRPAPADPPVAVRWRAIDVDRLGVEQRAL